MGKKKDKEKEKARRKEEDRPGRKDLASEVTRLQAENEALRARLERIAEIAGATDLPAAADPEMAILLDGPAS